ncbi:hypothetical protein BDM02DRAFT_3193091 [Thelephora ganbajun]|uniref:Uncharacterized protein n=1 Tax=Thelephora ganbajun TaxID=370292 RepID=A0ACB6YYJ8_THEGA|nr:hypothetical protein BDM02DRAFT_3193091 [Thelephora ganbajun]
MPSGTSVSNPSARQPVIFWSHDQGRREYNPERPGYSPPERVDLDKVLEVK